MSIVLLYFLKVNGLLLFFWLFYRMLLKKETFYTFNRWYFLTAIVASFVFPCVTFTQTILIEEKAEASIPVYSVQEQANIPAPHKQTGFFEIFDWQQALFYTIIFISIVLVFISVFKILMLFISIYRLPRMAGSNIRITPKEHNVYSFYRWIVVPKNIFNWPDYQMMIDHENVHLNQKHTLDLILIELVAKVFWFNPLIKYLQKDLNINLEFLVDEIMVQKHEAVSYQKSLLYLRNHSQLNFTNAFNGSDLKKRIIQLNTLKSNPMKKFKILITAPILLLFFSMFQTKTVAQVISISEQASSDALTIDPEFSKEDLKALKQDLKTRFGINLTINKVKYTNGRINHLKYTLKKDSYKISGTVNATEGIKPITITVNEGNRTTPFSVKTQQNNMVRTYKYTAAGFSEAENSIKKDNNYSSLFFIDDKESSKEDVSRLDPEKIISINVDKSTSSTRNGNSSDGVIHIMTHDANGEETTFHFNAKDGEAADQDVKYMYIQTGSGKKDKTPVLHLSKTEATKIINNNGGKHHKTIVIKSQSNNNGDLQNNETSSFSIGNKVIVKEVSSFNLDSKKSMLYVIDGKETTKEGFSKIDPKKIKNITILKEDSATNKYGEKAKDGVIEITTGEPISFRERAAEIKNREWVVQITKQGTEKRKELLSERKRILENRKKELENLKKAALQKSENS